jgi:hypothetical protein
LCKAVALLVRNKTIFQKTVKAIISEIALVDANVMDVIADCGGVMIEQTAHHLFAELLRS